MDRVTLWAIRVGVGLLAVVIIGAVVGGVLYGPRLSRALTAAAQGKADTSVAQAETTYAQDMGTAQAQTQTREVSVTLQMQEQTREILSAPGAGDLISPDAYGRFRDGVRRNRDSAPGGAGPAGEDASPGTAGPE